MKLLPLENRIFSGHPSSHPSEYLSTLSLNKNFLLCFRSPFGVQSSSNPTRGPIHRSVSSPSLLYINCTLPNCYVTSRLSSFLSLLFFPPFLPVSAPQFHVSPRDTDTQSPSSRFTYLYGNRPHAVRSAMKIARDRCVASRCRNPSRIQTRRARARVAALLDGRELENTAGNPS